MLARLFSEEELKELVTPLADRICDAIDRGNREKAKELTRQLEKDSFPLLYLFEEWVTVLLTYIGKNYGDKEIYEALRLSAESWFKPWHDGLAKIDIKDRIKAFAATMRAHTGRGFVKIEEDEEKFAFILNPCGSGLRMLRDGYYRYPKNLLLIEKAQPITFNRENFPAYCTHCAVIHQIMPIEWGGAPLPIMVPPKTEKEPCRMLFYKDPGRIPKEYYEVVGKSKQ